ncbi:hypothetical protein HYPBUDRAFT_196606 [Hyphopichia burtonii NRRL Y-1933]|uniref:Uncharacterized protein n=1 Tax=Hyphopichia burtonii NRRL Y-1933 TaxID=984485 RepID=A0A1E4RK08_9ASCO|nr:hypothetical protein HYPBUDRAFT_196606 [Hyphopichia burtonii NRRL Y-1933]ODV67560.1 hypothetical protein HYPBUDRAFT_196606 [Hyphopichia burtonii NRRL Y-1933]
MTKPLTTTFDTKRISAPYIFFLSLWWSHLQYFAMSNLIGKKPLREKTVSRTCESGGHVNVMSWLHVTLAFMNHPVLRYRHQLLQF